MGNYTVKDYDMKFLENEWNKLNNSERETAIDITRKIENAHKKIDASKRAVENAKNIKGIFINRRKFDALAEAQIIAAGAIGDLADLIQESIKLTCASISTAGKMHRALAYITIRGFRNANGRIEVISKECAKSINAVIEVADKFVQGQAKIEAIENDIDMIKKKLGIQTQEIIDKYNISANEEINNDEFEELSDDYNGIDFDEYINSLNSFKDFFKETGEAFRNITEEWEKQNKQIEKLNDEAERANKILDDMPEDERNNLLKKVAEDLKNSPERKTWKNNNNFAIEDDNENEDKYEKIKSYLSCRILAGNYFSGHYMYISPNIPEKIMHGAVNKYANDLIPEEVLAIWDNTILENGKSGVLFSKKAIYFTDFLSKSKSIKYNQISSVEIDYDKKRSPYSSNLIFNLKNGSAIEYTSAEANKEDLKKIIDYIISFER